MHALKRVLLYLLLLVPALPVAGQVYELELPYESYALPNGLSVVLHEDRSDPIVAVAILYHVGSSREEQGRTGFAHLFEHMMFQSSQHVGQDEFFQKIQAAGGTLNGGTGYDNTVYYQVVPNNALEMVLWLEADRMGYLLPTVTDEAFLNQQDVVQNEKRQRVDNVPYGHTQYVIGKLLYPEDHPYNWTIIGSFEDLANATMEDIQAFFRRWYGPNNATLVIAGDFDEAQTRRWVERYFAEIPSSPPVADPAPRPAVLTETKHAFHEDNFASSPELTMLFPTVEIFHPDQYALDLLSMLLSDGKDAPLYKTIVEEQRLAPSASAYNGSQEIAGNMTFRVRSFPGTDLTDVEQAVLSSIDRFEEEGFTEEDLDRIKAQFETDFFNGLSSVLNKAFQLAIGAEFGGSPGAIVEDLDRYQAVTSDDVWRVYRRYLEDRDYVATSFVPKGQTNLVADGSELFPVVEEDITDAGVAGAERVVVGTAVPPLPSSFDRSVQPPPGPVPEVRIPEVWTHTYANGLRILGIEHDELPIVEFGLTVRGGLLEDDIDRVGVANLVTDIMMEGTANRTPLELEEDIDALGANIGMSMGRESISIRVNALSSKLADVYDIFEEILLEPRWDETEFDRIKRETVETINRRRASPTAVASAVFDRLVYGDDHIFSKSTLGSVENVESFTIGDVRSFYEEGFSPDVSYVTIVGNISQDDAIELFRPLEEKWSSKGVSVPEYADPEPAERPSVYFVDFPRAGQSEIRIGHLGLAYDDPDFYGSTVMNHALGGSFNSRVNMILREERGYTYGARTSFSGSGHPGTFEASSAVRSNVTLESVQIFKDEIERFRDGISQDELDFTKSALIQSNARRFETLGALRGMLGTIAAYDLPHDYVRDQENVIREMTLEAQQALARRYIDPDQLIYLVVGDAETQYDRLQELGLGAPIKLDRDGNQVPVF